MSMIDRARLMYQTSRYEEINNHFNQIERNFTTADKRVDLNPIVTEALGTLDQARDLCIRIGENQIASIEDISKCMELRDKVENLVNKVLDEQFNRETKADAKMAGIEKHPIRQVLSPGHPFKIQIAVTDQNTTKDTYQACGYHALKNALIAVALSYLPSSNQEITNLFNDANFFNNEIHPFLNSLRKTQGDIDIATLTEGLSKILAGEFDQSKFPKLGQLAKILNGHQESFSLLNITPAQYGLPDYIFLGQDSFTIHNITNTLKAMQQQGPLAHAFVTGTNGHWVVLIMQKDKDNNITWLGADSWKNVKDALPMHRRFLDLTADQTYLKENLHFAYGEAVGETIKMLGRNVNSEGEALIGRTNFLTHDFQTILKNIHAINASYEFLKKLNLLKDPYFAQDVAALKSVALFYQSYLESLPDSSDKKQIETFFNERYPEFNELLNSYVFERMEISLNTERFSQFREVMEVGGMTVTSAVILSDSEKYFNKYNDLKNRLAPQLKMKANQPQRDFIAALKKMNYNDANQLLEREIYNLDRSRLERFLDKYPEFKKNPLLNNLPKDNAEALRLIKKEVLAYRKPELMKTIEGLKVEGTKQLINQKENLKQEISAVLRGL